MLIIYYYFRIINMLSNFLFRYGMHLMMLLCSVPDTSEYYLNKLIMRSGDVIFDIRGKYSNMSDDELYNKYRDRVIEINNVLLYEKLRLYINCHDLNRLFKRVLKKYTIIKDFRINDNSAVVMASRFGDEGHSVIFYRTGNNVEVINSYGGMGKIVTKNIPYERLLYLVKALISNKNKAECKKIVSEMTGIRVLYEDYVLRENIIYAYNFTDREIIYNMTKVLHLIQPYFKNREEYYNIENLKRELQ